MAIARVDSERLVYLTELTGMRLTGPGGDRLGRVREAALAPREHPRRVSRFLFGDGRTLFQVRFDQVRSISVEGVTLIDDRFAPYHADESHLLLARDLLDQQIVDVNGRKVVRVNDIALRVEKLPGRDELWVHEVGVGLQGAFRRLTEGLLPARTIRSIGARIAPNSIPWEYCNIVEPDSRRRLKLRISHDRIGQLHPADVADIIEELGPAERGALFETLDKVVAAQTLEEVDQKIQISVLHNLDKETAAEILDEMAPDAAADILNALNEEKSEQILDEMEEETKADVGELLDYDEDTAGGMMTNAYLAVPQDATVADALAGLRENDHLAKTLTHVFLIDDEERLIATAPIGRLFLVGPDQPLRPLSFRETVRIDILASSERVVELFDKYNCFALPVVDELGVLYGVITADDVIAYLKPKR
jgi:magnesium transporter